MKKLSSFFINLLLGIGVVFFIAAFIFSIFIDPVSRNLIMRLLPVFAIIIGIAAIVFSFKITRKAYQTFIGMFTVFWGIFAFLRILGLYEISLAKYWPLVGVTAGVFLFLSGVLHYKTLKLGFVIPSLFLAAIGGWLILFSCKIIKVPFKEVILITGPLMVLLAGIFIFILFLLQKKYKDLVLKDNDNEGFFEDDELEQIEEDASFFEDEE